jgi:glucosamine kinase
MWIGVDGGGTNLRVIVVDDNMQPLATYHGERVNPNTVGRDVAKERIQHGILSAIQSAGLNPSQILGIGLGIAGASARHSEEWLLEIIQPILPESLIAPSSDEEIGLVGARKALDGVFLIAGTGSAVYGIRPDGMMHRAGGWGYLLGDEGAGYWIGNQALRAVTQRGDKRLTLETRLPEIILSHLGLHHPDEIIRWTYDDFSPARIGQLAPLVIENADDLYCQAIIKQAGDHLINLAQVVMDKLTITPDKLAFGGSLLTTENALSSYVIQHFKLPNIPLTHYPPVIGAALLAKIKYHAHRTT